MVKIYNQDGNVAGDLEAPAFLSTKWNPSLVHQVFKTIAANRRKPIAHAKNRAEVSGGGKKPWKQKGTGRARQGSTRSPLWRHGGKSHGPRNTTDYSQKANKKMLKLALKTALANKLKNEQLKVLDNFNLPEVKSKNAAPIIRNLVKGNKSALVVVSNNNTKAIRALKNLNKVNVLPAKNLNLQDILTNHFIILEKEALAQIN